MPLRRRTNTCLMSVPAITLAVTVALIGGSSREALARKPKGAPAPSASASAPPADEASKGDEGADASLPDVHFTEGPSKVDLGHALTLALPESDRFLGPADADKILRKMGNLHNEGTLGLIAPKDDAADWFAVVEWVDEGHVADDDPVDARKLLEEMRDAQEEANPERVKEGFKALAIDGFQVAPAYDKAKHHLSWALVVSDSDGKSVNFNTRILGRTSYVSIDLVTDPTKLETFRGDAMTLLDATTFDKGQRYEDFDGKKDKVAEYGLAGLIAGGAGLAALKLAKVGILAKFGGAIWAFLLAAKKALFVGIAALGAWFKRIFGGKKKEAVPAGVNSPPELPGPPPAA